MQGRFIFQWAAILCFFVVALVMELAPWPAGFQAFKPSWLILVLLYWTLALPDRVSIGSLVLSITFYFVSKYYLMLRNLSLWFQSLLVLLFVFVIRVAIFLVEFSLHGAFFNWQEIFGAVASGVLWPWVFLLMRTARRRVGLH
ncbi:MAG: rod shape-determining protein MreD [Haemophilus parainfluenzae]|nr:rod shape-determining protein MreD [Haemophilus parainfluenzae]